MRPIDNQVAAHLEWCEFVRRMTPSTMLTKRKALERFIRVNPDLTDFTYLTNSQFDSWRASLIRQGKSAKTVNSYADHVTTLMKWLVKQCKQKILFDFDILERAEEDDPEITYYTPEEVALAFKHCRGLRDDLLLSLAYQSGLRLTEMATLKVEKIVGLQIEVWGKKRKRRKTFIREDTREKLDKWLRLNDIDKGYVFPSPNDWNSYLSPQYIRESFKGIFGRAGIEKRNSPHDMRHTWFTTMLDNGAPLMDTAIMGGHTDPKTTSRYYHVSGVRHAAIHQKFIPTANELTKNKKPVENRPQEMY